MSEKITIQAVAETLAKALALTKKDAETFVRAFVEAVVEGLEADSNVKVKGLGQFKLTEVADRESVAVATGERIVVPGYTKVTFQPDDSILEMLNPATEEIIEDAGETVKERPADEFSVIDTLISTPETIDEVKERLDSAKRKLEEKRQELEHLEMTVAELSQTMYNLETNARPSYLTEKTHTDDSVVSEISEVATVPNSSENTSVSSDSSAEDSVVEQKPEQKSVLTGIPKTEKEIAAERKREEERKKREESERKREEERKKREEEERKRKEDEERREQERRERKEEERRCKEAEKARKEAEKRRKKAEAGHKRPTQYTKWWIFSIVGVLILAACGYGIWNAIDGAAEKEQPVVVTKPKPKPKPKPEWPKEYVLQPGETLYGVAERFYGDSLNRKSKENIQRVLKAHKAIIAINIEKKRFKNPDNVQDGTKLILPKVE